MKSNLNTRIPKIGPQNKTLFHSAQIIHID